MWQVIGQDRAVWLLRQGIASGQLAHAYLFTGPPHVGKMTLATELARALNCQGQTVPCGECVPCRKIGVRTHADVQIVGLTSAPGESKKATEIGIDQIAEVQHSASLPPFEGKTRVFIFDGAELLSMEAANRLLKTLEEPEKGVVFILLTSDEKMVPATLISRCQRIELRPVAVAGLEAALKERYQVAPEPARLLARLSHGCPGWALSAASDEGLLRKRGDTLERLVTLAGASYDERFSYAGQLASHFNQERSRVEEILDLWLDFWRDLLLEKAGCGDLATNIDRSIQIADLAAIYSLDEIYSFIRNIRACLDELRKNVSPKLALEKLMLDMPLKGGALPAGRA